jgi:hypothetical protein
MGKHTVGICIEWLCGFYIFFMIWGPKERTEGWRLKSISNWISWYLYVIGYIRIYQGPGEISSVTRSSLLEINLNLHPRVIFKCNKCTLSMITMVELTVSNSIIFVWSAGKIWWRWGSSHRQEVHRRCLRKNLQWHIYKMPLLSPPWSIFIFV